MVLESHSNPGIGERLRKFVLGGLDWSRSSETAASRELSIDEMADQLAVNVKSMSGLDDLKASKNFPFIVEKETQVLVGERSVDGIHTRIYMDVKKPTFIRTKEGKKFNGAEKILSVSGENGKRGEYEIVMGERGHVGSVELINDSIPGQNELSPIRAAKISNLDYIPESRVSMVLDNPTLRGGEYTPARIGSVTCVKKIDSGDYDPKDLGEIVVVIENWYSKDQNYAGDPLTIVMKRDIDGDGKYKKYERKVTKDQVEDSRLENDSLVLVHWSTEEKLTIGLHNIQNSIDKYDATSILLVTMGVEEGHGGIEKQIRLKKVNPMLLMEKALEISRLISSRKPEPNPKPEFETMH